jgi:hypothetical protein
MGSTVSPVKNRKIYRFWFWQPPSGKLLEGLWLWMEKHWRNY